jgi:hypothetical protein
LHSLIRGSFPVNRTNSVRQESRLRQAGWSITQQGIYWT